MKLDDVIFYDHFPKLDLHGYDRNSARVLVNDFIRDHKKMKVSMVTIVHGVGSGILRHTVYDVLKKNKDVIEYKGLFNNRGCTLVLINIGK